MQHGPHWKTLRRFTMKALRDFGLGKTSLEEKIRDEIEIVLAEFDQMTGKPINPQELLGKAIANIICSIIFGQRSVSFFIRYTILYIQ